MADAEKNLKKSSERRAETVFNKACQWWMMLHGKKAARCAVMFEIEGHLEVFLSTDRSLEKDWPPNRSEIAGLTRSQLKRPHDIMSLGDLMKKGVNVDEEVLGGINHTTVEPSSSHATALSDIWESQVAPSAVLPSNYPIESHSPPVYHYGSSAGENPADLDSTFWAGVGMSAGGAPADDETAPASYDTRSRNASEAITTDQGGRPNKKRRLLDRELNALLG